MRSPPNTRTSASQNRAALTNLRHPTSDPWRSETNRIRVDPSRLVRPRATASRPRGQDDGLELGQALHGEPSAHPPHARRRSGPATEGQVRLPVVGTLVHVDPPGPDPLREAQPPPQ